MEGPEGQTNPGLPFAQVDSIHTLLKGPVMSRAFEETKHFPMDHSLQGEQRRVLRQGEGWQPASIRVTACDVARVLDGGQAAWPHTARRAPHLPNGVGQPRGGQQAQPMG